MKASFLSRIFYYLPDPFDGSKVPIGAMGQDIETGNQVVLKAAFIPDCYMHGIAFRLIEAFYRILEGSLNTSNISDCLVFKRHYQSCTFEFGSLHWMPSSVLNPGEWLIQHFLPQDPQKDKCYE